MRTRGTHFDPIFFSGSRVKRAIDENIRGTGITLAMHQGDHFGVKKLRSVCVSLAPDPRDKGPAKVA